MVWLYVYICVVASIIHKYIKGVLCMGDKNCGKRGLVYLKTYLFETAELVRKKLGLSRSGFYRYCVIRTLDSMSVLSKKVKED